LPSTTAASKSITASGLVIVRPRKASSTISGIEFKPVLLGIARSSWYYQLDFLPSPTYGRRHVCLLLKPPCENAWPLRRCGLDDDHVVRQQLLEFLLPLAGGDMISTRCTCMAMRRSLNPIICFGVGAHLAVIGSGRCDIGAVPRLVATQ